MKIAVTSKTFSNDTYLVNELKKYFDDVKINDCRDKLVGDTLIDFLKDCDGIILGTEQLNSYAIENLPCLKYVSKYGAGLSNIDFDALKCHGIELSYKKGVNSDSVAELVIGQTLNLIRRMDESIHGYRNGKWGKLPGRELSEITLGIIGYGHVGKVVAEKFIALGIRKLLVNDLLEFSPEPSCEFVSLEYLLSKSDVVTLHIDAENRNYDFVDSEFMNKMKDGSFLINTSRGSILDEKALVNVLTSKKLAGAALDVYKDEPTISKELRFCPNLLTSCHIAGSSNRAIKNMGRTAIEGILKLYSIETGL